MVKYLLFLLTTFAWLNLGLGYSQEMTKHIPTIRALAMGNAFTAVSDDYSALYYNPAGLARQPEWTMAILQLQAEGGSNIASTISDAASGSLFQEGGSFTDTIEKYLGSKNTWHVGFALTPYLMLPVINFGFGMFADFNMNMTGHRDPSIHLRAATTVGLVTGWAYSFFNDKLSLGFTLRPAVRASVDNDLSIAVAFDIINQLSGSTGLTGVVNYLGENVFGQGFGIGTDVGMMFTPFEKWKPTLGLVIQDLGDNRYDLAQLSITQDSTKNRKPMADFQSVNVGFSIKPSIYGSFYNLTAIDLHAINRADEFGKKLHMGTEFGWGKWINFGVGMYQMNWTAGMGLNILILQLRAATYAEELGPVTGMNSDRRYVVQGKFLL